MNFINEAIQVGNITPAADDISAVCHGDLHEALYLSRKFNDYTGLNQGGYFRRQFTDFERAVADVDGFVGVFATGHPFYAFTDEGVVTPIDEFIRYNDAHQSKLDTDRAQRIGGWPCVSCQVDNHLPDLKTLCKPCDRTDFKPRDLFKVLPDLDFWVVVEENSPELEHQIENNIIEARFFSSDGDIGHALGATTKIMRYILDGFEPALRLPIDLHIIERGHLMELLDEMQNVATRPIEPPMIPFSPRSLHMQWENTDAPFDFLLDFIFSLTPGEHTDEDLMTALLVARAELKKQFSDDNDIVDLVGQLSPRVARLLETPRVAENLTKRISQW